VSGDLWEQENGDDSFTELNRAEPGFNSGWVQIMGPPERIQQFKAIETDMTPNPDPFTATYVGLQQVRWLPTNIADTPAEALSRLFRLPGSFYSAPVRRGGARVPRRRRALPVRAAGEPAELQAHRPAAPGPRRGQRAQVGDHGESETLLFGRNFGIGTDVQRPARMGISSSCR